jgi:hypothetical protein
MPTTYTTSLRLWQGQPGDPAIKNNWGPPLNTNDNLLEAGILGAIAVSIAGLTAYTLTTANGAADQARAYIQQYTGALAANCTVTMPNVPKLGWAQNSTTGNHSVILTTGVGTTLTIPADGAYHWYRVDGSGNVTTPAFTFANLNLATLAVSGNGTIGGTLGVTGQTTLTGGALLPNNVPLQSKDTGGTTHNMLYYGGNNAVNIVSGTGTIGVLITNPTQSAVWLALNGSALTIANNASYSAYDSGGTPQSMLIYGADNNVYARGGTGGNFFVTNSTGATIWMDITASGGTLHGSNIITANGGTYGINITGSAGFATSAGSANSVAWGSISGIPSICYNNGGTYGINISGSAAFASSAGGVAWGNISGIPSICYNNGATYGINISGSASFVNWAGISGVPGAVATMNQNVATTSDVTFHQISATYGYQCRAGIGGPGQSDVFNINWTGANAQMWIDSTFLGNFAYLSDPRIKQNVVDAPAGALDRVRSWRIVEYEYKDVGIFKADGVRRLGFLADQLQKITASAVHGEAGALNAKGEIAPQTLEPIPLIAELAAAVQALSRMVADVVDENAGLKQRLRVAGL